MKSRIMIGLLALVVTAWAADEKEPKAPPSMPAEVTLNSGRVLRNVQVMGWRNDAVMLKHSAGANTIAFSLIKSLSREDLEAIRVAQREEKKQKVQTPRVIEGQAFIVSQGRTNYKLGDLTVFLVPKDEMDSYLASNSVTSDYEREKNSTFMAIGGASYPIQAMMNRADAILFEHFDKAPRGSISTKTDAEGRFLLHVPQDRRYYLFARDNRRVGRLNEWYVFLREVKEGDALVTLSNSDLWEPDI